MKSLFEMKEYLLKNGLHVKVIPLKGIHTYYAYIAAPVGSLCTNYEIKEKPTPSGIAHFLEHRLFDTPLGDAFQLFSSLGADANAFTTYEYTTYYFETSKHLLEGIQILLSMTNEITFQEEAVEKEKPIILEELYMTLDKPNNRLFHGLVENLIVSSPLKDEIVGNKESITSTTLEDLKRVFEYFYAPENLTLFLFGDINEELLNQIGNISLKEHKNKGELKKKLQQEEEEISSSYRIAKMDVSLPYIALGMKKVGLKEKMGLDNETFEALQDVVSNLLFSDASPLVREMHEENLIDTSVSGSILSTDDIHILYVVTSSARIDAMEAKLHNFLEHIEDYIEEESLKRATRYCYGNALQALDDFSTFSYLVVSTSMRNISYEKMLHAYETIQIEDVKKYLSLWRNAPISTMILTKDGKK